ncbi:hypothetical protein BJX63DRAFT_406644 [Aspergillus granulosus]|uniref:Uncharacterized protein n=1 Tax=Aspergillus granulosus TaxID=176169 RepID=A0ABR4H183_9EURO
MGPCTWQFCNCPNGEAVTDGGNVTNCRVCYHPMAKHKNYGEESPSAPLNKPPALVTKLQNKLMVFDTKV